MRFSEPIRWVLTATVAASLFLSAPLQCAGAGEDGSRVKAAEFPAYADWINTARDWRMSDFRGRFVLLDFWTFCCITQLVFSKGTLKR